MATFRLPQAVTSAGQADVYALIRTPSASRPAPSAPPRARRLTPGAIWAKKWR